MQIHAWDRKYIYLSFVIPHQGCQYPISQYLTILAMMQNKLVDLPQSSSDQIRRSDSGTHNAPFNTGFWINVCFVRCPNMSHIALFEEHVVSDRRKCIQTITALWHGCRRKHYKAFKLLGLTNEDLFVSKQFRNNFFRQIFPVNKWYFHLKCFIVLRQICKELKTLYLLNYLFILECIFRESSRLLIGSSNAYSRWGWADQSPAGSTEVAALQTLLQVCMDRKQSQDANPGTLIQGMVIPNRVLTAVWNAGLVTV